MISADVRIEHIRPEELAAAYRFATQPPAGSRVGDPRKGLVLVVRSGTPALLIDVMEGIVPLPQWLAGAASVDGEALRRLRRERGATWAMAADPALLGSIDAAVSAVFDPRADLLASLLRLAVPIREARRAGLFVFSPALLEDVPIPDESAVRSVFDHVFPDDTAALLYVFGPRGLSFAAIAEKRRGEIVRIAGHDALGGIAVRGAMWKAAVPRILEQARSRFAPPSIGVFADETALARAIFGSEPAALPRALASREIILDPLPAWLAVALGVDTAAKAAGAARDVVRRLDPLGIVDRLDLHGFAGRVQRRISSELPIRRMLGFDPFEVIARLHNWRDL